MTAMGGMTGEDRKDLKPGQLLRTDGPTQLMEESTMGSRPRPTTLIARVALLEQQVESNANRLVDLERNLDVLVKHVVAIANHVGADLNETKI